MRKLKIYIRNLQDLLDIMGEYGVRKSLIMMYIKKLVDYIRFF